LVEGKPFLTRSGIYRYRRLDRRPRKPDDWRAADR
jgi:hypothetical protein